MMWLRVQLITMLAGGVVYLIFSRVVASLPSATLVPNAVGSIIQRGSDSVWERIALWQSALYFIQERPLWGVGPGQFGLQHYPMGAAHPHNFPLQMLSEYGVFTGLAGIALMVLLLVLAIKTLMAGSSCAPDMAGKSIAAALIMGLTDSLFSGNQIMPHSQILLCVVAGLLVGRTPVRSPDLSVRSRKAYYPTLKLGFVVIAVLAMLTTTILGTAYLRAVKDMGPYIQRGNPHFWNYGRFNAW
jgi:O-antigen ligase